MAEIKRISPLSLAKIMLVFGLIYGVLIDLIVIVQVLSTGEVPLADLTNMILLTPIFQGVIWFVFGLFFSWMYNILAKKMGGIKINLK